MHEDALLQEHIPVRASAAVLSNAARFSERCG